MDFYDKLVATPLFQGLSNSELMQIIGQTKFAFCTFEAQHIIRDEGEPCGSMAFLLDGSAKVMSFSDDHGYSVEETLRAPYVIQPERLFGLTQRYTRRFVAASQCHIMELGKNDVMRLSDEFIIFRINLLNVLSTVSQKADRNAWKPMPDDAYGRIARFFKSHSTTPAGKKTIRIKMTRLAQEIGLGRLAVSKELNYMKEKGLLEFSRGIITLPAIERL